MEHILNLAREEFLFLPFIIFLWLIGIGSQYISLINNDFRWPHVRCMFSLSLICYLYFLIMAVGLAVGSVAIGIVLAHFSGLGLLGTILGYSFGGITSIPIFHFVASATKRSTSDTNIFLNWRNAVEKEMSRVRNTTRTARKRFVIRAISARPNLQEFVELNGLEWGDEPENKIARRLVQRIIKGRIGYRGLVEWVIEHSREFPPDNAAWGTKIGHVFSRFFRNMSYRIRY